MTSELMAAREEIDRLRAENERLKAEVSALKDSLDAATDDVWTCNRCGVMNSLHNGWLSVFDGYKKDGCVRYCAICSKTCIAERAALGKGDA